MCQHIHSFQKTPIEFIRICKGCGWKLHPKDIQKFQYSVKEYPDCSTILTERSWGKFKEEFAAAEKISLIKSK